MIPFYLNFVLSELNIYLLFFLLFKKKNKIKINKIEIFYSFRYIRTKKERKSVRRYISLFCSDDFFFFVSFEFIYIYIYIFKKKLKRTTTTKKTKINNFLYVILLLENFFLRKKNHHLKFFSFQISLYFVCVELKEKKDLFNVFRVIVFFLI